jgi:hypothetical protein
MFKSYQAHKIKENIMTEKEIREAYVKIRTIDNTIPDEVLQYMLDASLIQLYKDAQTEFLAKLDNDIDIALLEYMNGSTLNI